MAKKSPKVLLFNPPIYDFAAYDFWIKPLGLLRIGGVLRELGYQLSLVDCLDRHHPEFLQYTALPKAKIKPDGTGKFLRTEIHKPAVYKNIPRKYCRYGYPDDFVLQLLDEIPPPDVILITSTMTYWYPAVRDSVDILREKFPGTPVILGGIYATLCPEHARNVVQPDQLVVGEGEVFAARLVAELTGGPGKNYHFNAFDELPFPLYDLYPNLQSAAITTSKGCPYNCSFCAVKTLTPGYYRRSPENVLREIEYLHCERGVVHFTFYDDALLHQAEKYIKPILRSIIQKGWKLRLHTPNGLHIKFIDEEMADLLFNAGGKTIRLSFESSNVDRQKAMFSKVSNADLENALRNLENAGYSRKEIGVYVLMGLPDQTMEEVRASIRYVIDLGAKVSVASFSPIPQTRDWDNSIALGAWNPGKDLLLTNNTIFPIWSEKYGYSHCEALLQWAREKNASLDEAGNKTLRRLSTDRPEKMEIINGQFCDI